MHFIQLTTMVAETAQVFIIFSVLVLCTADTRTCPQNEEWNECDTACPPTCQNKTIQVCTDQCLQKCSCIKGYVRQGPGGPCVPESCEGVQICKRNERFTNCATPCPEVCGENEPKICAAICLTGCVCENGYIRSKEGECIPKSQCKACGINQEYKICGSDCPGTCSEPVKKCERKCVKGCFCKRGHVLHDESGQCIEEELCPK